VGSDTALVRLAAPVAGSIRARPPPLTGIERPVVPRQILHRERRAERDRRGGERGDVDAIENAVGTAFADVQLAGGRDRAGGVVGRGQTGHGAHHRAAAVGRHADQLVAGGIVPLDAIDAVVHRVVADGIACEAAAEGGIGERRGDVVDLGQGRLIGGEVGVHLVGWAEDPFPCSTASFVLVRNTPRFRQEMGNKTPAAREFSRHATKEHHRYCIR